MSDDIAFKKGDVVHCYHCDKPALLAQRDIKLSDTIKSDDWKHEDGTDIMRGEVFGCRHCQARWEPDLLRKYHADRQRLSA